jgi:hypothetical protein
MDKMIGATAILYRVCKESLAANLDEVVITQAIDPFGVLPKGNDDIVLTRPWMQLIVDIIDRSISNGNSE